MSYVKAFNTQLIRLLSQLSEQYPNDMRLKTIKYSISLLIRTIPKNAISIYKESVYMEYYNKIKEENDDFFLKMDLKGTELEEFEYVKNIWENSSKENRKIIWKYFHVFNKFVEKQYHL